MCNKTLRGFLTKLLNQPDLPGVDVNPEVARAGPGERVEDGGVDGEVLVPRLQGLRLHLQEGAGTRGVGQEGGVGVLQWSRVINLVLESK